jgi:16S rRNA (cytosine967-C5)-methyltransferase
MKRDKPRPRRAEAEAETKRKTRRDDRPAFRARAADRPQPASPPARKTASRIDLGQKLGAALALLETIAVGSHGADRAAAGWFAANRRFDGPPRGDIMETVEAVLRHRAALDWWIARLDRALPLDNRTRLIAAHVLVFAREAASLERAFDAVGSAPAPLSEAEQHFLAALKGHTVAHPAMPPAIRFGLPAWLEPLLRQRFGAGLETELAALQHAAPVDLRVNLLKTERKAALAALKEAGFAPRATPLSPLGIRLGAKTDIGKIAALADGRVEVQDEGSQIAALLADARPGQRVVDFCAGAGGKSLVMAAAMQNRGHLVALDVNEPRLARARQRLRRAGAQNAECRPLDNKWVKRQAGRADRVLVDAPCTGTGTWRRKPDARWRLQRNDLDELVARQHEILDSAQRLVKPGGRLVYVTCSLLDAENEAQIAAFLERHPAFEIVPVGDLWPDAVGGASPDAGPFLRLTPARHGTDGFFAAILRRKDEQKKQEN